MKYYFNFLLSDAFCPPRILFSPNPCPEKCQFCFKKKKLKGVGQQKKVFILRGSSVLWESEYWAFKLRKNCIMVVVGCDA